MTIMLTLFQVAGLLAAGWLFCLTWQRRHCTRETPVYVWPIEHRSRRHVERECFAQAEELYALKQHKSPGLQAQWDSGLGREFPLNHCN